MAAFYWMLLLFTVASVGTVATHKSQRTKRGILELAGAIKCSTGRSPFAYVMYGCYCGLGGQGKPKDKADWCCHRHDCCYGVAEDMGCHTKTDRYQWKCDDKTAECDDLEDTCKKMLCKCDRDAAKCLRKSPYNTKYRYWPDFLCTDDQVTCNVYSKDRETWLKNILKEK
ncbi:group 10 secretory phospholipase A2 [Cheilinus undulatus]|uniref:group 10 secretory phospholipase A2 n=1 Tax=Cheilinus undulatus TaxID=241271 RepID=UPI001BD624F7|nr:group 10 secretory phospholipase A2 [Cheilinus undulatus]